MFQQDDVDEEADPATVEADLARRIMPHVVGTATDELGSTYTLHDADSWVHMVSRMMLIYKLKWWTREETLRRLVRYMLHLQGSVIDTITRETGQDPVMRCMELGGEESGWGGERVEVLCLLSLCQRGAVVGLLRDDIIETIEVLYPVTTNGVDTNAEVLPCIPVIAPGRWLLAVPVP